MFGQDIGLDLGTASVIAYVKGKGIVLSEEYKTEYKMLYAQAEENLSEGESVDISAVKTKAKNNVLKGTQ